MLKSCLTGWVVICAYFPFITVPLNWPTYQPSSILQLVCLYCLPPNRKNELTDALSFEQFSDLLEHFNTMKGSLLLVGDLNIYVDVPIDPLAVCLSALLDNQSLHQSVPFPTHLKGHTLDLVLTKHDDTILQYTEPNFFLDVSNHSCEMCQLRLTSFSCPCTLRQGTSILLDVAFKPDFSTFHSSQLTDSITFCCTSLTNTPQSPGIQSPPGLPHCGLLPLDHTFMRPNENGREKKGSGSHQDWRFINRFSMLLTNSLTILYISLKFRSIMLKF